MKRNRSGEVHRVIDMLPLWKRLSMEKQQGMRKALKLLLLLLATTLCAATSPPSPTRPEVTARADRDRTKIGDVVRYSIAVTHPPGISLEMPGPAADMGVFEVRDYRETGTEESNGLQVSRCEYEIAAFEVGELEIPPLEIRYSLPGESTPQIIATEKLKIVVESLNPDTSGDIRDIKSPAEIPRDWLQLAIWGALAVALAGVALATGYWFYRRRGRSPETATPKTPPRPAHEVALEALDRLESAGLPPLVATMAFYIEASQIIRRYIEERWAVAALEMSSFDLLEGLQRVQLKAEVLCLIRRLLERCDLVKFAKYEPPLATHGEVLFWAREIVLLSIPPTSPPPGQFANTNSVPTENHSDVPLPPEAGKEPTLEGR